MRQTVQAVVQTFESPPYLHHVFIKAFLEQYNSVASGCFACVELNSSTSYYGFLPLCNSATVGGVVQWLERRSWPANFPCPVLDQQRMDDQ